MRDTKKSFVTFYRQTSCKSRGLAVFICLLGGTLILTIYPLVSKKPVIMRFLLFYLIYTYEGYIFLKKVLSYSFQTQFYVL
jgi:hypothetical protein